MVAGRPTVTGSATLDRVAFALLLVVVIVVGVRTRVYYTVTATRVSVVAVADHTRTRVRLPAALRGVRSSVAETERSIRRFAATPAARALAPRSGSLSWYVEYSVDSLDFDHVRLVATTHG